MPEFYIWREVAEGVEKAFPLGCDFAQLDQAGRKKAVQDALQMLAAKLGGMGAEGQQQSQPAFPR